MPEKSDELSDEIRNINATVIPSVETLFDTTVTDLHLPTQGEVYLREHFEEILSRIMKRGLELLEHYQMEAQRKFLEHISGSRTEFEAVAEKLIRESFEGHGSFIQRLSKLMAETMSEMPPLTEFNSSISNMRKSRAGSMFTRAIHYLLERCGVPSEVGGKASGRLDLIIPNYASWQRRPENGVLLELKAMHIRERWKTAHVETHSKRGPVWIVTLDTDFGTETMEHIRDMGLHIYCPESMSRVKFRGESSVRALGDLVRDIESLIPRHPT